MGPNFEGGSSNGVVKTGYRDSGLLDHGIHFERMTVLAMIRALRQKAQRPPSIGLEVRCPPLTLVGGGTRRE